MYRLNQLLALLQMGIAALAARRGLSLVTVIGVTCVVGVLISMLSMGAGARQMALQGARPDRAFVTASGAASTGGTLSRDAVLTIEDDPRIKRNADGKPLASAMQLTVVEGRRKLDDARVNYPIFGVQSQYFSVMPAIRMRAGRVFRPAVHELIVGQRLYTENRGLEIGDHLRMRGDDWIVVGHFEGGGWMDSFALTDADTLLSAFKLGGYWCVQVMLDSPAEFDPLKRALKANPSINVEVQTEAEFLVEKAKGITGVLDFVSYFVGGIMAAGATLGAVNAMYALVDQRRRDIATLRAIGFGSPSIITAMLIESVLLALPGAALGALLAALLFNGHHASPMGAALDLAVTPHIVALGILWALCMGLIGGLLPALRAARVPVATALRAS